jgi:hypothetical protein
MESGGVPQILMTEKKPRKRRSRRKLIRAYAEDLPGSALGIFWREFRELVRGHGGIYVLYKEGVPHYVGKASNLPSRIRAHLKDRLKRKWDTFSLYVVRGDRHIKDVESLLLRIVKPKGALVSGRFRGAENLKKSLLPQLRRYADALAELKAK